MIFFPMIIRGSGGGSGLGADCCNLYWKALNKEYTEKYGPITDTKPCKEHISCREVTRGGKVFLKDRILGIEIEK